MAVADFFLKLDGVKGDSTDATHAGEIDIESFSWGESQTTSIGSATSGAGAGKVKFDELTFTSRVHSGSQQLALMCASGAHAATAVLTVRKAGGKQEEYYKVTFKTVFITHYRSIGAAVTDVIPRDEVTCVFGTYLIEYRSQTKDGTLAAAVMNGWDQIQNKKA